jgi:site-specific DNA-methyltransferase (adenine-specific)
MSFSETFNEYKMDKYLNKICYGDNLDLLKKLPDESISLCITSPPYKDSDDYDITEISKTFREIYRVLKKNSLFFLNFGHLAEDKFRPFRVCYEAMIYDFKLNDTITWKKTQFSPIQGKKRLNNLTEFIFLLYKGKMPDLDRLSVGVPYKDKSNIGRYSDKDLRCQGNHWEIGYETIQNKKGKLHNDRFPLQLPTNCIKLSGIKNGVLLDPFSGSFTSQIAAQKLGLNWLGIDKNYPHCQTAQDRFFKEFNQEIEIVRL